MGSFSLSRRRDIFVSKLASRPRGDCGEMLIIGVLTALISAAGGVQFDKEHPLDWQTLNATRGLCGILKCYFPLRLSEHEAGQAC